MSALAHPALEDFASFARLEHSARTALAERIAAELGAEFRGGRELVGDAVLACIIHQPSGVELVLIPGGVFQMGFTGADREALERFFPRAEHRGLYAALQRTEPLMTPARAVTVRPFALARRPLAEDNALAHFVRETHAESFSREEAEAVLAATGLRFPSEAECEYVGREGKQLSFLLDVAAEHFEGADSREETAWGIAEPGQTVWVGDRWHRSYKGAPRDAAAWTKGRGLPMHRGSFSLGLSAMQSADELVFALAALRQQPLGDADENDVRLRFALGPDEAGRWGLSKSTRAVRTRTRVAKSKPVAAASAATSGQTRVTQPLDDDSLALLAPAAAVRACVEIALSGAHHDHCPEPTWPLLVEAGADNSAWARATLERIEAEPPVRELRSMTLYALVYPLAVAGLPVQARWTTHLDLVAPPQSIAVWEAVPESEREAAMLAVLERVLRATSVLNDTLFFVKRYPRPALARACLTYFTSKEGSKKHGVKTMRAWVQLLRVACVDKPALREFISELPPQ